MRIPQGIASAVLSALIASACGRTSAPPAELPALAVPSTFRAHAERLGCTMGAFGFFGDEAFACVKSLQPCGCTLVLKTDTVRQRDGKQGVNLVKADLFGCPPGTGDMEVRALLEPLIPAAHRSAFSEFIAKPVHERSPAQAQRYGAFQTGRFDSVHARSFFGVETATPRRTVWLDRFSPDNIRELIVDAPAYGWCPRPVKPAEAGADERDAGQSIVSDIPVGSCDHATDNAPPCELGDARWGYRRDAGRALTFLESDWRVALYQVARDRIERRSLALDERRRKALVATLVSQFPIDASGTPNITGLTAAELAERAIKLIPPPDDDAGFQAYLKTLAGEWNDNVESNLGQLLDRDLELLVSALARTAHERTPQALEAAIARALK